MKAAAVIRRKDAKVVPGDWGELTWFANREIGNTEGLTVGRCVIRPGCANPRHLHPNCEEVLHVLAGRISHSFGASGSVEMAAGDTIVVPANLPHNATNIGETDTVLMIAFSSADRQTKGE